MAAWETKECAMSMKRIMCYQKIMSRGRNKVGSTILGYPEPNWMRKAKTEASMQSTVLGHPEPKKKL